MRVYVYYNSHQKAIHVIDRYRSIPYPTVYLSVHKEESGMGSKVKQRRLVKMTDLEMNTIPIRNESTKMEVRRSVSSIAEVIQVDLWSLISDRFLTSLLQQQSESGRQKDEQRKGCTESPAATALLLIVSAVVHICSCTRSAISVSLRHYAQEFADPNLCLDEQLISEEKDAFRAELPGLMDTSYSELKKKFHTFGRSRINFSTYATSLQCEFLISKVYLNGIFFQNLKNMPDGNQNECFWNSLNCGRDIFIAVVN
ncbi:hypothetical protein PRIPAC_88030 [Pristionchus pacificus]|uniref:Uncharacterized protein n=1 Tax=Pristionchus pacificus TaxID=54126 RepID=A0A2A6CWJ4_PRIPA|nr:hypothetical protein PRIPAC_88030 [Pristionchus pacificus]|eukprot:PDM82460.1 hypothetical protein PRIPAC_36853 [Pristionchus pacificus]